MRAAQQRPLQDHTEAEARARHSAAAHGNIAPGSVAPASGRTAVDAAEKSPGAYRSIGEVADALQVPAHVLRFWETQFRQIRPMKGKGNRRYFRPQDVDLLHTIKGLLYESGWSIREVRQHLTGHAAPELPEENPATGLAHPMGDSAGDMAGDLFAPRSAPMTAGTRADAAAMADDDPEEAALTALRHRALVAVIHDLHVLWGWVQDDD